MTDELYEECCAALKEAVLDKNHPWKIFAMGNVDLNGDACVRNVILRYFKDNVITFYTDQRSQKVEALNKNPTVSLCFYNHDKKIQLQIKAKSEVHLGDSVCKQAWDKTAWTSLLCYYMKDAPNSLLSEPFFLDAKSLTEEDAYKNFSVIKCHSLEWEILELKETGNQKSKIVFDIDGSIKVPRQFLSP
jgi:pyridoxamine 5'-phosphate oxidase